MYNKIWHSVVMELFFLSLEEMSEKEVFKYLYYHHSKLIYCNNMYCYLFFSIYFQNISEVFT